LKSMAETAPAPAVKSVAHRERRNKLRKSAEDLCLVTVEMEPAGFGLMLDASEGGLGVQVMNRIEPGTNVQIAFKVPELAACIEGSGVITWSDGDGRVGIRFQRLKDESNNELRQWIDSLPESTVYEPVAAVPRRTDPVLREQVRAIQAQIAASHLDVSLVLQFLVERVVGLTHSNGGAIALGQGDDMVCRASTGLAPDVGVRIGTSSALTSECLRTANIVRCDDTETDVRVNREICRELNLRSSLIFPILFEGKVSGVLEVFSPVAKAFNEQHLALLQQLADFASQIVYGPITVGADVIELTAKSQAKPEHTALSALLSATTKAPEGGPSAKATSSLPAFAQPAPPPKLAQPVAATQEFIEADKATLHLAAPAHPIRVKEPAAEPPERAVEQVTEVGPIANSETSLDTDEEASASHWHTILCIVAATFLLVIVGLGWWYKLSSTKVVQQPTTTLTPTVQVPVATTPAPVATSTTPPQSSQSKPAKPPIVSSDTVRGPHSAIIEVDQSMPLVIAPGSEPLRKIEAPAEAPSINVSSSPTLGGINFPGATARPTLQPQSVIAGGKILREVEPKYPLFAQQHLIQGDVVLSARVMKDGSLDHIKRISGNPVLEPAAVAAVRQWKYEPYKLDGQAQEVDISVIVKFRLKQ
jgi:TonB family protein